MPNPNEYERELSIDVPVDATDAEEQELADDAGQAAVEADVDAWLRNAGL